ncbi:hypothetical protein AMS68_000210 [Peltaster fructicola]|uniref:Las1-like protein n=1 Tax=Peltaster fructicola TaxID=286661 RepID=A0A6H0XIY9_9PEZI|nr:hypothetical protein AMS68_000210 [Peltaster fructicola]
MPAYIVTPWRTQGDLLAVRQQLYRLDGEDNRRHAVNRVMAWRLRGNLPHAVESTALLMDAFLHHDISANSSFSIRAVYSAAFCRFVTGFCDIGRNRERSLEPSSMLDIARQIDMPADFVALRHEATHEELPSERRIVIACEDALQWLWRVYWSRLDVAKLEQEQPQVKDAEQHHDAKAFAQKMFRSYRSVKRESLKNKQPLALLQQQLAQSTQAFAKLCADDRTVLDAVAEDIVEKGLLLPSDRRLGAPLDGAFLIWDDLLQAMCQQQRFISPLTAALLNAIASEEDQYDDSQREAYALWLSHICCSAEWESALEHVEDTRRAVMKSCITHPGVWTSVVAESLITAGDDAFVKAWKPFLDAARLMEDDEDAVDQNDQMLDIKRDSVVVDPAEKLLGGWHRAVLAPTTPLGVIA